MKPGGQCQNWTRDEHILFIVIVINHRKCCEQLEKSKWMEPKTKFHTRKEHLTIWSDAISIYKDNISLFLSHQITFN